MCESLAGNAVELLTITSFACDPEELAKRKGIVISSRVHPGESNSALVMEGIIDYLTGPSLGAKILRDNFVFKVRIPLDQHHDLSERGGRRAGYHRHMIMSPRSSGI